MQNPLPSLVEPKFDGIRVFLFKSGDKLVISSKHGALYTPQSSPKVFTTVPEFLHAPHRMILDGEYVAKKTRYTSSTSSRSTTGDPGRWR